MKRIVRSTLITLLLASAVCAVGIANAAMLDLTTLGASGPINGAIFEQISDPGSVGSGVIDSFVRIQANGTEEGYNSDFRPVEFNEHTTATFNHSLLLSSVPVENIAGVDYRQFLLDINESGNEDVKYISLDKLEVYLLGSGGKTGYENTPDNAADPNSLFNETPIYSFDFASDGNWIKLDYSLNSGSGNSYDMFAYIPDSLFTGSNQYIYLYSRFGDNVSTDNGFEEWAVIKNGEPPVPEPSGILALLVGLVGVGGRFRRRTS